MLKNLKKWFIVDDEEFKDKVSGNSSNDSSIVPEKKTKSTSTLGLTSSPTVPSGKSSPKFTNILLQAMDANNLDGFDYLEYKNSLHNLAKMPMDEKTRYQSAFAAASTMGATPAKLIKTAHFYIDVLKKEESKFAQALANQKDKQIGDKAQLIQQHDNLVKEKSKQIEQLKKEISQHQTKSEQMKKSISAATVKVEATKNNFVASYTLLLSQIKRDIENMKKYLK
ncbi:hypothetical protein N9H15_01305 [bacterium]|nr:hypothetical protein [bacterium]